LNVLDILLQNQ